MVFEINISVIWRGNLRMYLNSTGVPDTYNRTSFFLDPPSIKGKRKQEGSNSGTKEVKHYRLL